MAEILLTAVINKSIDIAANLIVQEGTHLYWLKEDIDWLQRVLRHIRSYVDNAKAKEVGGDSRIKNLLKDIPQLAGDVEDLLDEFLPKIQQSNKLICCLKTVSFADEFAMEIKKLYRHVRDQFECSALVYVSQQPRAGEILIDIAKQVGLTEQERKENMENNLRSLFKIKRYVILLDDIWDVEIWDDLKLVLPECDSKIGSRIIITSRNSNVGRYIGGDFSIHVLQPLDSQNSFELFTKKFFTFDNNNNWANASPDLVNIGRSIVGRCGGIPLAIVVTAGMLRARE